MSKIVLVYWSGTGNTEAKAQAVAVSCPLFCREGIANG